MNHIHIHLLGKRDGLIESQSASAASALGRGAAACIFHKNLPHYVRRYSEEVRAILPLRRILSRETQVGLVYERGALQRVITSFLTQVVMCQPTEFVIDEWHQRFERFAVSVPPSNEQLSDRTGRLLRQGIVSKAPGDSATWAQE